MGLRPLETGMVLFWDNLSVCVSDTTDFFFGGWEMEDYTTRTYGTGGLDNRPLFGETSARDRIINLAVGSLTSLLLIVTLISAFIFPQLPPKPVNIFFAFCISLCSVSAGILIYWYRQGDLEPKFRNLIYYILFSIVMLCICANLYFHEVGKWLRDCS